MAPDGSHNGGFTRALGIGGMVIGLIGASLGVAFAVGPAKEVSLLRDDVRAMSQKLDTVSTKVSTLEGTMIEHIRSGR